MLLVAFLAAGCGAPRPMSSEPEPVEPDRIALGDSAMQPRPATQDRDLVREGGLTLDGPAAYELDDLRWISVLRAETAQQRAAAERMASSGAFLGDSARVIRLAPAPGRPATATFPRARVVGATFQSEVLVRVEGEGPAPTLRFEHAAPSACAGRPNVRCAPSAIGVEFVDDDGNGYDRARILLGDGRGPWSEQPAVALPPLDWRGLAHRIGLVVEENLLVVSLDGAAVLEQEVYVVGPEARPLLRAEATAGPVAALLLLTWTFVSDEE